jgi:hypothetical protein
MVYLLEYMAKEIKKNNQNWQNKPRWVSGF